MGRDRHWTEAIADDLRKELDAVSEAARSTFAEVRRLPKKPSTRERLRSFMNMDKQERLALFAQMGPEQYGQFLRKNMDDLVKLVGPQANVLYPYFYADGIGQAAVEDDVNSLEAQLNSILEGDDTALYEPLLEELE